MKSGIAGRIMWATAKPKRALSVTKQDAAPAAGNNVTVRAQDIVSRDVAREAEKRAIANEESAVG